MSPIRLWSICVFVSLCKKFDHATTFGSFRVSDLSGHTAHLATVPKENKMSDLAELVKLAKELGLSGEEAKAFVKEQQDHQRDYEEQQRKREEKRKKEERMYEEQQRKEEEERRKEERASEEQQRKEEELREERREQRRKEEREYEARRRKEEQDYEQTKHERALQLLEAQSRMDRQQDVSFHQPSGSFAFGRGRSSTPNLISTPKFEDHKTKDVRQYLTLFESIMIQNNFAQESWALALRTAVMGSKLSDYIETLTEYSDMKREILLICGHSPQDLWRELVSQRQLVDESFRQFTARTKRRLETFFELATAEGEISETDTLLKYIILDKVTPGLKTHLVENKISSMSFEEFQIAGSSYQEAHGRPGAAQTAADQSGTLDYMSEVPRSVDQATTSVWRVTVEDTRKKIAEMEMPKRRAFVLENRLCFNCLKPGHQVTHCRSFKRCQVCHRKHDTLLHEQVPARRTNELSSGSTADRANGRSTGEVESQKINMAAARLSTDVDFANRKVFLMTAAAKVRSATGEHKHVRILFDGGAQASFVSRKFAAAVQAEVLSHARITIQGFGTESETTTAPIHNIGLVDTKGQIHHIRCIQRDTLNLDICPVPTYVARWWHEKGGMELSDVTRGEDETVSILIGADYLHTFLKGRVERNGEIAFETDFGLVLSGPSHINPRLTTETIAETSQVHVTQVRKVAVDIEFLWELEQPAENIRTLPAFPMRKDGRKYEVGLLWKDERRPEDNKAQAVASARTLMKRLERSNQREAYENILMKEYVELDAIEPEPEPTTEGYYMPHHAIIREEAVTTKVRVVFNASAARKGTQALNDVLDPGPSLLPQLPGLLIRFREFKFAIQGDIRKAFFMIGIKEEDRQYLRFVWPNEKGEMSVWRLKKLPFGVNCAPFIMGAVINHHLDEAALVDPRNKEIICLMKKSFYVDDLISSLPNRNEVSEFQEESTKIMQQAGMELRKWRRNDYDGSMSNGSEAKVLGLCWNDTQDTIHVCDPLGIEQDPEVEVNQAPRTRRQLLHLVASLFDPLGMVCPVTIVGKIILQAAWKDTLEWDEEMSEPLQRQAREWWGDLKKIQSFKVERWCGATPETEHTLHCFSDASETAYGCCIYITSPTTRHLVYAKAKVAPVKRQTLARLELQAAFMASSALDMVCNHVRTPICEVHCWTDSLTTFHWLNKPPHHWKTWVANRVAAIQEVGLKWNTEWHHCPGVLNPADLVSRGVSLEKLEASKWLKGPDWITSKEMWPLRTEVQEHQLVAETRVFSVQVTEKWWERFSSWDKIQRIMRVILRWRHFKDRTVNIARKVEISLWQIIQRDVFGEDLTTIKNGKSVSSSSKIHKFNPFLDEDGVLRVGGRLQQTTWPFERKHPVLLDKHHLTELLVRHHHIERKHQGVEGLVAFIRRSLWIIGGRKMIRKMKDKCIVCRKFDANPIDEIIAPLPAERVNYTYPFGICGVDYAGPLLANGGGRICKVWVALFVCATTRAVHLEMVTNLTTDEFLLAFRRFIARRAKPQKIFSDNATTFRAAAEAIQCTWEFNPPAAPWFGGFYERLVQSV